MRSILDKKAIFAVFVVMVFLLSSLAFIAPAIADTGRFTGMTYKYRVETFFGQASARK